MKQTIEQTFKALGITRNYRGYKQLFIAIELVLEDEDRLLNIIQDLYMPTAAILQCHYQTIERNIRTLINRVWHTQQHTLFRILGYKTHKQPTVSEFIDLLAIYVIENCKVNTK